MSSAEKYEYVSVEDYLAAEDFALNKSEYIEGWIRAMTGANLQHNQVKGNCFVFLANALKGKRCGPYDSDTKLRIVCQEQSRFYYPNVQVVCDSNTPTDVHLDIRC